MKTNVFLHFSGLGDDMRRKKCNSFEKNINFRRKAASLCSCSAVCYVCPQANQDPGFLKLCPANASQLPGGAILPNRRTCCGRWSRGRAGEERGFHPSKKTPPLSPRSVGALSSSSCGAPSCQSCIGAACLCNRGCVSKCFSAAR